MAEDTEAVRQAIREEIKREREERPVSALQWDNEENVSPVRRMARGYEQNDERREQERQESENR